MSPTSVILLINSFAALDFISVAYASNSNSSNELYEQPPKWAVPVKSIPSILATHLALNHAASSPS
jgi:hypothetical protein